MTPLQTAGHNGSSSVMHPAAEAAADLDGSRPTLNPELLAAADELASEMLAAPWPGHSEIPAQLAWAVVAALWTAFLLLHVLGIGDPAHIAMKALLMPSLLLWVAVALGRQTPAALATALALATAGDIGVNFEGPAFLVGMAAFLGMQVGYSGGMLRMGAWRALRQHPALPIGVFGFWMCANLVLGPMLGSLRVPVLVYSLSLCLTAMLASGLDRRIAVGAATFLASDLLIGLRLADLDFPHSRLVVDALYLAAQYLIITGWVRRTRPEVWIPA